MDLEFDFKGDPIGGVISNCKCHVIFCSFVFMYRSLSCIGSFRTTVLLLNARFMR